MQAHLESQLEWNHREALSELLAEINQRPLKGMKVETFDSQWRDRDLGLATGVRIHSLATRGFGSYKTTYYFEIALKDGNILGRWVTVPAMKRLTWWEVFRLPLNEQNLVAAVNQALSFIVSKA